MRRRSRAVTSVLMLGTLGALAASPAGPRDDTTAVGGEEAYGHVVDYVALPGLPRTGTPGGDHAARWIAEEMTAAGLEVASEPFGFDRFAPRGVGLDVDGFRPAVMPLYYSGATAPDGITAPLIDVGLGTPAEVGRADVAGRIALVDVPTVQNGFAPTLERALTAARDAGAVAVVASLRGTLNHIAAQNADARGGMCELPVLVVGKQDGARLRDRAGGTARFRLAADLLAGEASNVVGVLPGRSDDVVIVGTPYNGWFDAAAERGGGIGVLLTLARAYATAPTPPEHTLVFVATAGHEVGFLGLERFVAAHPDLVDRAIAYVHLGATVAAKHYVEVDGAVVETGLAEPLRALFTSENPVLEAVAESSFRGHGPATILSIPPGVQNPGEQRTMYGAGVPIVSVSGGHLFFHTPGDLPETTSPALLQPVVDAYSKVIDQLLALDRDTVHAANAPARAIAGDDDSVAVHRCP